MVIERATDGTERLTFSAAGWSGILLTILAMAGSASIVVFRGGEMFQHIDGLVSTHDRQIADLLKATQQLNEIVRHDDDQLRQVGTRIDQQAQELRAHSEALELQSNALADLQGRIDTGLARRQSRPYVRK